MTAGFSGTDKCASCESFPLRESVGTGGRAVCEWWGDRAWSDGACVLHNAAPDRRERKDLVKQLATKDKQKGK